MKFKWLRFGSKREAMQDEAPPMAQRPTARIAFYSRPGRPIQAILMYGAVALFCLVWGFGFSVSAPGNLVAFMAPLALLAVLAIWALPEGNYAPLGAIPPLFIGFYASLMLWPNYLAVALPGLPWITMIRIFSVPLVVLLLIAISSSKYFRSEVSKTINLDPIIWKCFVLFVAIQIISLAFSANKMGSLNRFLLFQINITSILIISCFLFRRPGFADFWAKMLMLIAWLLCLMALWEKSLGHLPWSESIPSFLRVEDPAVLRILKGSARSATKIYRVQGTSSTPLGLAEFLGLTTPFIMHFLLGNYKIIRKIFAAILLPLMFYVIILTDSRLGIVACLISVMFYLLLWALLRWRANKTSLIAPAIVISYPVLFCGALAAFLFLGRLRSSVLGSGAQQASTEGRKIQWARGWPLIATHPLGHGQGMAAGAIGFSNGSTMTIDSYWLAILLDFGPIGFLTFYFVFLKTIWNATRAIWDTAPTGELRLLMPLAVSLMNFFVIKSVFFQEDNHPLAFMMVAAALALTWRAYQPPTVGEALPPAAGVKGGRRGLRVAVLRR